MNNQDFCAPGITEENLTEFLECCGATHRDLYTLLRVEPASPRDSLVGSEGINGSLYGLADYALQMARGCQSYAMNSSERQTWATVAYLITQCAIEVDQVIS